LRVKVLHLCLWTLGDNFGKCGHVHFGNPQ
jgi:hypothetical protein